MPLEPTLAPLGAMTATVSGADDLDYWHGLIDEKAAADFLGLVDRTMQALRRRGGGPRYYALSRRCLRYRRIDLQEWTAARVRKDTSDTGLGAD